VADGLASTVTTARVQCSWLLTEYQEIGKPQDVIEGATHVRKLCEGTLAAYDAWKRAQEGERMSEERPISQATIIGQAPPQTWQELARDCKMTFGGGYLRAVDRAIFHHGIQTAFNLINGEFPPLADVRQMKTALADLKTVAEGLAQRLRDPFYEGLDEGYVSCDMCSSEEGRPGPRRSCEGCNETGGCGDYELMHSYDAWKEKNP